MGELPVRLPISHRVCCGQLFHHSGGDEEAQEGKGHVQFFFLKSSQISWPTEAHIQLNGCLRRLKIISFPPTADPRLLQCCRGHGLWWVFPRQRNWPGFSPRQHPKHREEHPVSKLYRLRTHRRHQATAQAPFKTKHELHNEQQLHDRLIFQSLISPGLPALQHHLLEYVCIVHWLFSIENKQTKKTI